MSGRTARLPLRVRLIGGFAAAMVVVLIAAGAFVYWRVQYALDHRINGDLTSQAQDLRDAAARDPATVFEQVGDEGRRGQLLRADGTLVAAGAASRGRASLLTPAQARIASRRPLRYTIGGATTLLSGRGDHLRLLAVPAGRQVAVAAIALNQRDEALRELLAQLVLANAAALLLASAVGYRLASAALRPVEDYRAQAAQITAGATGLRLAVDEARDDEITRLGHTLNDMIAEQERAAARLRQFVDDASHELRTPLAALSADVELALRKPRPAAELEATLQRVALDTQRLVELASELLELSAVGEHATRPDAVDAADLLEAAARRARSQLPPDSARAVTVDMPSGLVLHGERALLDRALGNLVDNAARHGGGAITLGARPLAGGAGVALSVSDEGPGMPAAFLPQATERFRRADSSRSTPGNGIGLSLVAAITAAHDGQLLVCSGGNHHAGISTNEGLAQAPCEHPPGGTTITILLPAQGRAPSPGSAAVE